MVTNGDLHHVPVQMDCVEHRILQLFATDLRYQKNHYIDSATVSQITVVKGNTTMVGPRRITYVASERLAKVRCSSLF